MFTLGRKIDLRYKPNLIIVLCALIVSIIGGLVTGEVLSGIYLGVGVFLTWALSRELDPAHDYSAFIAAALSLFMLFYFEAIHFLIVLWLLLLMRAVNGITGKQLTLFDIFAVVGFTVYLSLTNENSIYLLIFILAMAFIIRMRERTKIVWAAVALGSTLFIIQSFFMNPLSFNRVEYFNPLTLLIVISAGFSPIIFWFLSQVETEDDNGNQADRSKVFISQLLYSISVLLFVFIGDLTFNEQIIYSSAIIGITLHLIGTTFIENKLNG